MNILKIYPGNYKLSQTLDKEEKKFISYIEKNVSKHLEAIESLGIFMFDINPIFKRNEFHKFGMYISENEGLVTFSFLKKEMNKDLIDQYIDIVKEIEANITERLLGAKMLIKKVNDSKILKFPYRHIIVFSKDEPKFFSNVSKFKKLSLYAAYNNFWPLTLNRPPVRIKELALFNGDYNVPYDKNFKYLTSDEIISIIERLAPEYTCLMKEKVNISVEEGKTAIDTNLLKITGNESEYKVFMLDDSQVKLVNEFSLGHRVLLANPGAGKSVILLSKAFKFCKTYQDSNVLLTCYNNNLADSYNFKKVQANMRSNNLYVMTFHKLVSTILKNELGISCVNNYPTEDQIKECIQAVSENKVNIRFDAIFIDEVQIFDPLYLELCYKLLKSSDSIFLMAGDINQSVRNQSRRGDVPWKKMNVQLDFTGRVRYIEKNYRNTKEISLYLSNMLEFMNCKMLECEMERFSEYDCNNIETFNKNSGFLKVELINRAEIKEKTIKAVKNLLKEHKLTYSDIAIIFPYKTNMGSYSFLYWLKQGLEEENIPYSLICTDGTEFNKTRYSKTNGITLTTIDSSLGLDFKAVILAGLYPCTYVSELKTNIVKWEELGRLTIDQKNSVQTILRKIYTACSRAREYLYCICDLPKDSMISELLLSGIREEINV